MLKQSIPTEPLQNGQGAAAPCHCRKVGVLYIYPLKRRPAKGNSPMKFAKNEMLEIPKKGDVGTAESWQTGVAHQARRTTVQPEAADQPGPAPVSWGNCSTRHNECRKHISGGRGNPRTPPAEKVHEFQTPVDFTWNHNTELSLIRVTMLFDLGKCLAGPDSPLYVACVSTNKHDPRDAARK